jgi:tight adherence protein C
MSTPTVVAVSWTGLLVLALIRRRPGGRRTPRFRSHEPLSAPVAPTRPRRTTARARRRHEAAVAAAAPDLVDLFAVAIAAGLNVRLAVDAVSTRAPPGPLRQALAAVRAEVAAGHRLADALERLPATLAGGGATPDETLRGLTSALVDAERYGTALGPTLDRLAAEARRARQRRAEEAARRIPVQLLFPLVTCILPAFGLLTVAPLIAGGLRALRL